MKRFNHFLAEAANDSFSAIIENSIPVAKRKVQGRYSLQKKSFKMTIDRRDQDVFKELFKKAPDKTVGNGEISLFWLFNYGSGKKRAYETRGGNEPDLKIDGTSVEVKAYPKHDPISLGRFQDRRVFRSMVNTLFGVSNLFKAFEGGTGRGQQTFKGELSFRYPELLEAAQHYKQLEDLLMTNKELTKNFKIFRDMAATTKKFREQIKSIGCTTTKCDPNEIALTLMKDLIRTSVGDKPGDKGYIVNLKDKDPLDVWFHYIDFNNMTEDEKILSQKGTFTVNGGVFKANFTRLFG